jgi:hypothetical protein
MANHSIRGWCFTACHPTTCSTRRCPGMEDSGKRLPHRCRCIQPEYVPHVRFVVDPTLVLRHSRPCSLSPSGLQPLQMGIRLVSLQFAAELPIINGHCPLVNTPLPPNMIWKVLTMLLYPPQHILVHVPPLPPTLRYEKRIAGSSFTLELREIKQRRMRPGMLQLVLRMVWERWLKAKNIHN